MGGVAVVLLSGLLSESCWLRPEGDVDCCWWHPSRAVVMAGHRGFAENAGSAEVAAEVMHVGLPCATWAVEAVWAAWCARVTQVAWGAWAGSARGFYTPCTQNIFA
jgi:hypothetical protein